MIRKEAVYKLIQYPVEINCCICLANVFINLNNVQCVCVHVCVCVCVGGWVGGWVVCVCCKGEELVYNPVQPPSEKLFVKRYNFLRRLPVVFVEEKKLFINVYNPFATVDVILKGKIQHVLLQKRRYSIIKYQLQKSCNLKNRK